jgi:hypothetical protein
MAAGIVPINGAWPKLLGLRKLQAKAVPNSLSVLTTTASEDIAHLFGGVVIALPL